MASLPVTVYSISILVVLHLVSTLNGLYCFLKICSNFDSFVISFDALISSILISHFRFAHHQKLLSSHFQFHRFSYCYYSIFLFSFLTSAEVPINLSITATSSSLYISWLPPEEALVDRYNLEYAVLSTGTCEDQQYAVLDAVDLLGNVTNYTISGLQAWTTYLVTLRAVNIGASSSLEKLTLSESKYTRML